MAAIEKRVTNAGEVSYRVKVRLKGHPVETATFERLTDARKWGQETEVAIRERRYFKTSASRKHTLAEAIQKYKKEILAHKKGRGVRNVELYLRWWETELGPYHLADVTASLISECRTKLLGMRNRFGRTVGPTTANRYTQALGHVFTISMNEWEWVETNPLRKVSKYRENSGRTRFLSDEERVAVLAACKESDNPYLYTAVVLALSTGARKNEIMTIKWQDVDLRRGQITLHQTKNGEKRALPLHGHALSLINAHQKARDLESKCDYVFPSEQKCQPIDIRRSWENALIKAGVTDFRFHDLRHSAASYLAMNGASLAEIAEVLGHKTLQMVKRYAHISKAHTHSVVASMNERIFGDV
jgi:integrase